MPLPSDLPSFTSSTGAKYQLGMQCESCQMRDVVAYAGSLWLCAICALGIYKPISSTQEDK